MRHDAEPYLLPGVFAPTLSLDELVDRHDGDDEHPHFDITDDAPTPDALLERAQAHAAVDAFVDSLPQRDREFLRRVYWEEQTQTEVAADFGISKMAVSKALKRILKRGGEALLQQEPLARLN